MPSARRPPSWLLDHFIGNVRGLVPVGRVTATFQSHVPLRFIVQQVRLLLLLWLLLVVVLKMMMLILSHGDHHALPVIIERLYTVHAA